MPGDFPEPITLPEHLQVVESWKQELLQAILPLHQLLDILKRPRDQETSLAETLLATLSEGNELLSMLLTESKVISEALSNLRQDMLTGQSATSLEVQMLAGRLSHLSDPNAGIARTISHIWASVGEIQRVVQDVQVMLNGPVN